MTAIPQAYPARQNTTLQVNYFRKAINFNDAGISSPTNPFGKLPLGAFITRVTLEIVTAFNAATTNVLTVGTTAASANEIVAAGDADETVAGAVIAVTRALGSSICRTAEQNLYAKYTQTGTAATAGKAIITIEFIPDNDG